MKTYITFLLLIAAMGANAQTQVTSKSPLGDLIWLQPGAYEVSPFITGSGLDTIRSLSYKFHPVRDTTSGTMLIEVTAYNKSGSLLSTEYITVPQSIFGRWKALINALDAYIAAQRKRITKL